MSLKAAPSTCSLEPTILLALIACSEGLTRSSNSRIVLWLSLHLFLVRQHYEHLREPVHDSSIDSLSAVDIFIP